MRFGVPIKTYRKENGKLILGTCDKSERNRRGRWGGGGQAREKRFLENLGTCVRHILYIRDFVLVYHVQ